MCCTAPWSSLENDQCAVQHGSQICIRAPCYIEHRFNSSLIPRVLCPCRVISPHIVPLCTCWCAKTKTTTGICICVCVRISVCICSAPSSVIPHPFIRHPSYIFPLPISVVPTRPNARICNYDGSGATTTAAMQLRQRRWMLFCSGSRNT